jgi:S-adenosylhomocysteine hydrolase
MPTSATGFERWTLTEEIPERMPVLDRWLERAAPSRPLAGVTALLIQHQLGNHYTQAKALIELGVSPQDLYWVDVPYTSTPAVRARIEQLGVPRDNFALGAFRVLDPYGPYQRKRVQAAYARLLEQPPERLVVLDDGSYFLEAMSCFTARLPSVAIVEQTTRGLIRLEDNAAMRVASREVPVINVARSAPKSILEPPFIGAAVCDALRRRVGGKLDAGPRDAALVFGYGAIGLQVAEFVYEILHFARERVHVFDTDPARVATAISVGFSPWDRSDFTTRFRLVVGCSGRASFGVGDYVYLAEEALLASASSGTVELAREDLIELADGDPDDDIWVERDGLDEWDVHSDLRFHFVDRSATFVNAGFPVNFDGRVNCVPAHYIQPTPTMMCAAAVQAAQSTVPGVQELDTAFCAWLDAEFRQELGGEAARLGPAPGSRPPSS